MVYPLLWQLTMAGDSCFKWSVHMNHGIIIALSWWEYWKIYLHAQCKELIGVCFQGHIATLHEPKKTGRVLMRHFRYSAAPVHTVLFAHTGRYLLSVTFSHGDTFTQSFLPLNSQRTALFTCVVMFLKKQTPIKSSGLNSQLRSCFLRLCGFWRTGDK